MESPDIKEHIYNITSFGAQGDCIFLNTAAIQSAIDAAHQGNGGTVVIPSGTFLAGSLVMKSGVRLHLEAGATLLGSVNRSDYFKLNRWPAFILADGQSDLAITGAGTIDGQGRELALKINDLYYSGGIPEEHFNRRRNRANEQERPQIIEFVNCRRVRVAGVTIKNAAGWVQTYSLCDQLTIERVVVDSDAFWNNDGIDVDDCANVRISNCDVNSADDGICLKSENADSGCGNVIIEHCRIRSSANAVKFGTASRGGFRNVTIRDISVHDTYRSAIALEAVDGGVLEHIDVSGIYAYNTGNALFIRLGHRNENGSVSAVRDIRISGMRIEVPFHRPDSEYDLRGPGLPFFHNPIPASITGIPGHYVENVTLEDVEITYPGRANRGMANIPLSRLSTVPEKEMDYPEFTMFEELPAWGLYVRHAQGLKLKNIRLRLKEADFRPAFVFDDVRNLTLEDMRLPIRLTDEQIAIREVHQANMHIRDTRLVTELERCSGIVLALETNN